MSAATEPRATTRPRSGSAVRRSSSRGTPSRRGVERRVTGWRLTAAVALAVVVIFPLYWMLVTALSSPGALTRPDAAFWPTELRWENFTRPLEQFPFARWALNSATIAVISVALTVAINLAAGYAFAKLDFPFKNTLFLAIVGTLMVPVQVVMVAQFQLVIDLGLVNTPTGVVLPRLAEAFGLFMARQFMDAIPDELLEAARVDGAGALRTFVSIVLPLSKPLVAVLVIFTFMWRWNEFIWPLIVLPDPDAFTLPLGLRFLQQQFGNDYGSLMAMSLLSILPMLLVFAVFQRYFVEGVARSGLK